MHPVFRWALSSATALVLATAAFTAAGADVISHEELMTKLAAARTSADHEEIAAIYDKQATADLAAAEEHRRTASFYRGVDATGGGRSNFSAMAVHCKNLADGFARAAKEHSGLAELHRKAAADAH
jgi:hypothetical protein